MSKEGPVSYEMLLLGVAFAVALGTAACGALAGIIVVLLTGI